LRLWHFSCDDTRMPIEKCESPLVGKTTCTSPLWAEGVRARSEPLCVVYLTEEVVGDAPTLGRLRSSSYHEALWPEVTIMKRTVFVLGMSAMLALPLLARGQMTPSAPGTAGGPGVVGGSSGARMEQEERRGQTGMHPGDVRQAQERLKEAGFNPGPVDGQLGAQTKDAIKDYQKTHGLPQTGELDEPTRDLLMAQTTPDAPERMNPPRGSTYEQTRPGDPMPGGRTPGQPTPGSNLPGGSGPGR
jgi:Putative peptidoglycan binding domain